LLLKQKFYPTPHRGRGIKSKHQIPSNENEDKAIIPPKDGILFDLLYNCQVMKIDLATIINNEVQYEYIRAPGPGGQNVNKVATAVQLRFDAAGSPNLTPEIKSRLLILAGRRATSNGEIVISAHRYRSQEKNREDALIRLLNLIRRAEYRPPPRRATHPTRSSQEKRLAQKKRRSEIKRGRSSTDSE
jgi:ribosome-associated protein